MLAEKPVSSVENPLIGNAVATVEDHLEKLRTISLRKLGEDPLPHGKEAEKRIRAEIRELDLEKNVAELETQGYTILAPGEAGSIQFAERLRDKIMELIEAADPSGLGINYRTMLHSVPRDPIFEEAVQAPRPLCLLNYLLGYRAKLSSSSSAAKGRTEQGLMMHADQSTKIPSTVDRCAECEHDLDSHGLHA